MDGSDYDILLSGDTRTETFEDTTVFTYSTIELESHNVLATGLEKWMKRKKTSAGEIKPQDIKFLKFRVTHERHTQTVFTKLEQWYVEHVAHNRFKGKPELRTHLVKLLMQDPVGITEPDKDDPFCWTRNTVVTPTDTSQTGDGATGRTTRSATATPTATATAQPQSLVSTIEHKQTEFLVQLKHAQRSIYLHLRATLPKRFSDNNTQILLESFINDKEDKSVNDNNMSETNRFDVGTRISWKDIKAYVLQKVCVAQMGSHYFLSLFTTMRKDGQTVTQWMRELERLYITIVKQGTAWKTIAMEEIVPAVAVWITTAEQRAIMDHVHKQNLHNRYETFEKLTTKMHFAEFRQLCNTVPPKQWPSTFKQSKHTKAKQQTLLQYAKVDEVVAARMAKVNKENTDLSYKLKQANDKIKNLEYRLKQSLKLGGGNETRQNRQHH